MTLALVAPVAATTRTIDNSSPTAIADNISTMNSGDILVLEPGTYYESGITVSKDLTIKANASATPVAGSQTNTIIDAQNSNCTFIVSGSNSITLDNLKLINGKRSYGGGAITASAGSVTLINSSISDCSSSTIGHLSGGAIYGEGSNITLINTIISDCWAADDIAGGAIFDEFSGSVTLINSSISDCTSNGNGGAIFQVGNSNSGITLTNSTISDCSAGNYGGALYTNGGTITLTSSSISDCSAGNYGGALYTNGGTITLTSSTIFGCTAGSGDAIYSDGRVSMKYCRIYQDGSNAVHAPVTSNVNDNWWGTNSGPTSADVSGPTVDSWLVLGITASPTTIKTGGTSTVRANLTWNNTGHDTSADGLVPDGIPIVFTLVSGPGSISPTAETLTAGANSTVFTASATTTGTATVNATADGQTVTVPVIIAAPTPTSGGHGHQSTSHSSSDTTDLGYTGPQPTAMGYIPTQVQPAVTPVVAQLSQQVAGSTPAVVQQTVAALPAASTVPLGGIPVVQTVAVLAGIGVIAGGGLLVRRWWIQRQNPALFKKYD
jgi:hypothetical protein